MNRTVKEIVKCCFTCKHYHFYSGECNDKNGKLFLLNPKELPCKFWEDEKCRENATVEDAKN